jgi:uncharacterized protein YcbK (DUF882 family)
MQDSSRRRLLGLSTAGFVMPALLLPRKSVASMPRAGDFLSFVHTHTGERMSVAFRAAGSLVPDALRAIDRLLRDHRSGDVRPIDPALLSQLHRVAQITGTREPFQVISAYRSDRTNEMLRRRGGGVARGSLHLQGRAIDVRLADVPLSDLRDAALELRAGGVGYYPGSQFVHLDTGRVRSW